MDYPLHELIDRYSILLVKAERSEATPELKRELLLFHTAIFEQCRNCHDWVDELRAVNGAIWTLEAEIRGGRECCLGLEEVGRRALAIRDRNRERIAIKNRIAAQTGGFKETKVNHASE